MGDCSMLCCVVGSNCLRAYRRLVLCSVKSMQAVHVYSCPGSLKFAEAVTPPPPLLTYTLRLSRLFSFYFVAVCQPRHRYHGLATGREQTFSSDGADSARHDHGQAQWNRRARRWGCGIHGHSDGYARRHASLHTRVSCDTYPLLPSLLL